MLKRTLVSTFIAIAVATYIPVLGGLFILIVFFMVVGAICQILYIKSRNII